MSHTPTPAPSLRMRKIVLPSAELAPKTPPQRKDSGMANFPHVFELENFLSEDECRHFITQAEDVGFCDLSLEYPPTYRNNQRVLVSSNVLAKRLYQRLEPMLRKGDIVGMKPYGFDQWGTWFPAELNTCFKFSRYSGSGREIGRPQHFSLHMDGTFVKSGRMHVLYLLALVLDAMKSFREVCEMWYAEKAEKVIQAVKQIMWSSDWLMSSAYELTRLARNLHASLQRPLLDHQMRAREWLKNFPVDLIEFKEKISEFLNEHMFTVKPETGKALVFNHDVYHEGDGAHHMTKYIVKTELIFRRDLHGECYENEKDELTANRKKALELYDLSDELEKSGDVNGALQAYLSAQRLQAALPTYTKFNYEAPHDSGVLIDALPTDTFCAIFKNLSVSEIYQVMLVSKHWCHVAHDPQLWLHYFGAEFPHVAQMERYTSISNLAYLRDWFTLFRNRHGLEREMRAIVVDLGSAFVKIGKVGSHNAFSYLSIVGRETHPHHLIADYTEVDTYRFGFDAIRSSGSVFTKEIIDEKTGQFHAGVLKMHIAYALRLLGMQGTHPLLIPVTPFGDGIRAPETFKAVLSYLASESNYPLISFQDESVLALTAHRLNTGVVVHCGASSTYIMPIVNGVPLRDSAALYPFNFSIISDHFRSLCDQLGDGRLQWSKQSIYIDHVTTAAVFISENPEADLAKATSNSTRNSFWQSFNRDRYSSALNMLCRSLTAMVDSIFAQNPECFMLPERYFNEPTSCPASLSPNGRKFVGLPATLLATILNCPADVQGVLHRNIVLTGGAVAIQGFSKRFHREYEQLLSASNLSLAVDIHVSNEPDKDILRGGIIFAELSSFRETCEEPRKELAEEFEKYINDVVFDTEDFDNY